MTGFSLHFLVKCTKKGTFSAFSIENRRKGGGFHAHCCAAHRTGRLCPFLCGILTKKATEKRDAAVRAQAEEEDEEEGQAGRVKGIAAAGVEANSRGQGQHSRSSEDGDGCCGRGGDHDGLRCGPRRPPGRDSNPPPFSPSQRRKPERLDLRRCLHKDRERHALLDRARLNLPRV